jgi:transcriptional regulator with XRE-family HTH domain
MADSTKPTFLLNVRRLDELLFDRGMTLESLALKSGIDLRTIQRKRSGRPANASTIHCIADVLATPFRDLVVLPAGAPPLAQENKPSRFRIHLSLSGTFQTERQKEYLQRLNTKVAAALAQEGIDLTGELFKVATSHIATSGAFRFAIAVLGDTEGIPSWFIATVKPTQLTALCQAEQIDPKTFPYGEVLQVGWGDAVPRWAIRRTAALLGCQPTHILDQSML